MTPALLTSRSSPSEVARKFWLNSRTDSRSARSSFATTSVADGAAALMAATAADAAVGSRLAITTRAPARASSRAITLPRPPSAPVTTAVRPPCAGIRSGVHFVFMRPNSSQGSHPVGLDDSLPGQPRAQTQQQAKHQMAHQETWAVQQPHSRVDRRQDDNPRCGEKDRPIDYARQNQADGTVGDSADKHDEDEAQDDRLGHVAGHSDDHRTQ